MTTTRTQQMAQRAFEAVSRRIGDDEYASFAKSFPALIQTAGLCQAVAFATAKSRKSPAVKHVLEDVVATIDAAPETFANDCRTAPLQTYIHLTRRTLQGAMWVKRSIEAVAERTDDSDVPAEEAS